MTLVVLGDGQPGARHRQHRHPARLPQLERGLRVHIDEHFLDGPRIGPVLRDHGGEACVQLDQPLGHGGLGVGADLAIGDV